MFSWSSTRKGSSGGRTNGITSYPATRPAPVAQTIQGTIRPPDASRQQHLDSYMTDPILLKSTKKVFSDDSTFDTVFRTTSGEALILRVHFPNSSAPPQMTLVGVRATHPWLDPRMRVIGYTNIQSEAAWNSCRLLLGQVVHEVVQHLQLNPPIIMEITDPGLAKLQQNNQQPNSNGHRSPARHRPPQHASPPDYDTLVNALTPPSPVDMPPIPQQFPDQLDTKSREELQNLLDDDEAFQRVLDTLPIVAEMKTQRESLLEENTKRATALLERQEELTVLHGEVTDMQASLKSKLEEFETFQALQEQLVRPPDLGQLKRDLNKARKQAMDDSEDYAADWIDVGGDIHEFCRTFVQKRNLMHTRAAKLERLAANKHR